ncbi:Bug family tripartite tricarboxylate transporter substrate binding protein [Falsiroseomonas tokyonensis]|uniref:Bug family tripartite tricarboxylate transporter substrate binding protein n=1 Tax=Falsiroseomonas tokyonensis TaxID=430521 RepID=A0ABV7BZJ0_9PROT|nr:tripartite tricarboxylate transporter substrate binding protein [Falsiroseomonas tokyonensis]MBU8540969.1 tripartite tricarboxylate transporter substrate binding protein [Falsiroseomonas tokyonensis]
MDDPAGQAPHFRNPASRVPALPRRAALLAMPALLGLAGRQAQAQEAWPSRPISVVVPGPPGGTGDVIIRGMVPTLSQALGVPIVVENRPGANGEVGTRYVARSAADGYTLLLGSIGHFAINFALRPNLSYDPVRDLDTVTLAATTPNVLVVNPRVVPATDLPGLVAWLRSRGDQVSYATSGIGSSDHLTAELFKSLTDTKMQHVPYPGGPPALTDLLGGNVQMAFFNLGNVATHVREGRLRAILITSRERAPLLPEVPSGVELGLRDLVVTSWQGFAVPAGTPAPIVARLHRELAAALRNETVVSRMGSLGFNITASTPEEFRTFQLAEIQRWRSLIDRQGIRAE